MKPFPVGKAQKMILDALGVSGIETYADAEAYFASIGISVLAVRKGRTFIPEVYKLNGIAGWTPDGDAEPEIPAYPDFSLIAEYMAKEK